MLTKRRIAGTGSIFSPGTMQCLTTDWFCHLTLDPAAL